MEGLGSYSYLAMIAFSVIHLINSCITYNDLAAGRSKRQVRSKTSSIQSTLEKIREQKKAGISKNKYELKEDDRVYDVLDDEEYADLVTKRQREDWIEDDGIGEGYVEHGREIFDDDAQDSDDDDNDHNAHRNTKSSKGKQKKKVSVAKKRKTIDNEDNDSNHSNESSAAKSYGQSIKEMFKRSAAAQNFTKKKPKLDDIKMDDDELLKNILSDMNNDDDQDNCDGILLNTAGTSSAASVLLRPLPPLPPVNMRRQIQINNKTVVCRDESQYLKLKEKQQKQSSSSLSSRISSLLPDDKELDQILESQDAENDLKSLDNDDLGLGSVSLRQLTSKSSSQDSSKILTSKSSKIISESTKDLLDDAEWNLNNHCSGSSSSNTSGDTSSKQPEVVPSELDSEIDYLKDESTGKTFINFYYVDASESLTEKGVVYLFGKYQLKTSEKFISCCIRVEGIEKRIFIMPRQKSLSTGKTVSKKDVEMDFDKYSKSKYKMDIYRFKFNHKKYSFDNPEVPKEGEFMELLAPANSHISNSSEIQHDTCFGVCGANVSSLERIIIDRKLKGPSWIRVFNPKLSSANKSWCKIEFTVDHPKHIVVDETSDDSKGAPLMTLISLCIRTYMNPMTKTNEIIAISVLMDREFDMEKGTSNNSKGLKFDTHFCLVTKPSANCNIIFPIEMIPGKFGQLYKKTKVDVVNSEREMLNLFMAKFHHMDPDIIVGHDIFDFDLDVLMSRLTYHKTSMWSKLGRLKRSSFLNMKKKYQKASLTCGRLVVDIKVSAKELIKSKSYDLTELSSVVLNKNRIDVDHYGIQSFYSSVVNFNKFIDFIMIDNSLILNMMLELNVIPLSLEITKIAGNSFSRTLMGGRSERNEFLLLHAFTEANHLVPDKEYYDGTSLKNNQKNKSGISKKKKDDPNDNDDMNDNDLTEADHETQENKAIVSRKKPSYAGGLVLEPKIGYYSDYVLILDFNSLYPTIMREYNICFTTIDLRKKKKSIKSEDNEDDDDDDDDFIDDDEIPSLPPKDSTPGILPTQITKLVESRREVKKQLSDGSLSREDKERLDIKQKALKLTANSMYGCLGFKGSRFYAKPLAALITFKGREILMSTKYLVENNLNWKPSSSTVSSGVTSMNSLPEVIYGDTDSIMINTKSKVFDDAIKISTRVEAAVNKEYKYLEIDCDGVLKSMLLLKKKKYAALTVTRAKPRYKGDKSLQLIYKKEMKGLDIVRRDWSMISKKIGEMVVDHILCIKDVNSRIEVIERTPDEIIDSIHQLMKSISDEIRSGSRPLSDFIITKQLTKNPTDYQDRKSLSHVLVAIKWNESSSNSRKFKAGDVVPFIVALRSDADTPEGKRFNSQTHTQRAIHPEYIRRSKEHQLRSTNGSQSTDTSDHVSYVIDANYYLSQQIHPVVTRLIEPLDGTDAHTIAEFLGLDASAYHSSIVKINDPITNFLVTGAARFEFCDPLTFKCPVDNCNKVIEVRNKFFKRDKCNSSKTFQLSMTSCPFCNGDFTLGIPDPIDEKKVTKDESDDEDFVDASDGTDKIKEEPVDTEKSKEEVSPPPVVTMTKNGLNPMLKRIIAQVRLLVRSLEKKHQECWFTCEDPICAAKIQIPDADVMSCRGPKCQECKQFKTIRDVSIFHDRFMCN